MSGLSVPLSVPVKVQAQETNVSFTQSNDGYFMNLDLKLELPLQDLVDSLLLCGDKIIPDHTELDKRNPVTKVEQVAASPMMDDVSSSKFIRSRDPAHSFDTYYSAPFPRFDSPYRKKGRWQPKQATFFMRDSVSSRRASPAPSRLSADAPVFTPMTYASVDSVSQPDLWELPGLPSPLMEPSIDPIPTSSVRQTSAFQSILQRGLSNVLMSHQPPQQEATCDTTCRQM